MQLIKGSLNSLSNNPRLVCVIFTGRSTMLFADSSCQKIKINTVHMYVGKNTNCERSQEFNYHGLILWESVIVTAWYMHVALLHCYLQSVFKGSASNIKSTPFDQTLTEQVKFYIDLMHGYFQVKCKKFVSDPRPQIYFNTQI